MTYNGHNNFSNSAALSRGEEEEKWWLVFWECQLSGWLYSSLRFFFSFSTFPFFFPFFFSPRFDRIASHLRNIIWFEIQHFPLCHVLGSVAHALCRSLISIHSLLKCSSIHLERMWRLARRVERILLNERWQRPLLQQQDLLYKNRLQSLFLLPFYCFDWVLASLLTHILFSHLRSHIKPKHIFSYSDWLWYVTSIQTAQDALRWRTSPCTGTDAPLMYKSLLSLLSVWSTSSDDPHVWVWVG